MRALVLGLALAASGCSFAYQMGPGREEIGRIHPGVTTRAEARDLLEKPNGVDLARFASWEIGEASLVLTQETSGSGEAHVENGDTFRVVARFMGDKVIGLDVAQPVNPRSTEAATPPQRLAAGRALVAAAPGPGTSVFALDEKGTLLGGPGASGGLEPLVDLPGPFPAGSLLARDGAAVAVSADGRFVAASLRGALRVVDVERRAVVALLEGPAPSGDGWDLAFSPDGQRLAAAGDRGLIVYQASGWETAWRWPTPSVKVAFSPDGRRLVAVGAELQVLDAASGAPLGAVARRPEGWRGYAIRVRGEDVLAAGPGTMERWSLPALEQAWRSGQRKARTTGGADEPALLDVRALPLVAGTSSFSRARSLSPDGEFLVEAAQAIWVVRLSDLAPVVVIPSSHFDVARFDLSLGADGWLVAPEGKRLLRWNLTAWR